MIIKEIQANLSNLVFLKLIFSVKFLWLKRYMYFNMNFFIQHFLKFAWVLGFFPCKPIFDQSGIFTIVPSKNLITFVKYSISMLGSYALLFLSQGLTSENQNPIESFTLQVKVVSSTLLEFMTTLTFVIGSNVENVLLTFCALYYKEDLIEMINLLNAYWNGLKPTAHFCQFPLHFLILSFSITMFTIANVATHVIVEDLQFHEKVFKI